MKFGSAVFALLLCMLLACAGLWGQSTAQIQGLVQDASGSAVPGAEVKAIQTDTGAVRTATSGADGLYVLASLPIGPYRLEVSKNGFTTFVQTGIVLQVASTPTVDVALQVGATSEQVRVEANAALVETEKTGIGTVVENRRILELPLNGRNVVDLIQLAGSAIPAGVGSTGASQPGAQAISVAGGQNFGVTYWLDGAEFSNPLDATSMPFPFPDALQEFKVETSALSAQNGVHSGASINAVTKSGTNAFHGDAFEFLRNGDVNARNFFATTPDSLKRNQFGGTFGGPIKKNKLFFFGGYQGTRIRQDSVSSPAFVPTAAMLDGNFTQFASAACNGGKALTLGAPFVNDQVSPSLFSPVALKVASYLPTTTNPCGRTTFGAPLAANQWQAMGRVDYQLSDKQTIFGRYMNTAYFQEPAVDITHNVLSSTTGGHNQLATSVTLGDTYLVSPSAVNSLRVSFNRSAGHTTNGDFFSGCDVGVNLYCYPAVAHNTILSVTGGFTVGSGFAGAAFLAPTTYQIGDDFSWVRGAHQFSFGFTAYQYRDSTVGYVTAQSDFAFTGLATGNGMGDFLLGDLSSLTAEAPNTQFTRKNYIGAYGQDVWKLTPRLTLSVGLRWEPFIPEQETNKAVYNFSLSNFQQNIKTTQYVNAPPGFTYPGDPGFQGNFGINHEWNLWAPRVGIAWDPIGDGKTSIRAAYGLSYDFVNSEFWVNSTLAPPWGNLTTIHGPISFADPWATVPGGNIFPYAFNQNAPFASFGSFISMPTNMKTTSVNAWNLSIQRQIASSWLVSVTYAGSETSHLWASYQLNPGVIVPSVYPIGTCPPGVTAGCNSTTNLNERRVLYLENPQGAKGIGYLDQFDDGGTSSYNAAILTLQKRLSRGVSINANYTWSHCIGDPSEGAGISGSGVGFTQPDDRRADRGNCVSTQAAGAISMDRRQIVNVSIVAQSPSFANHVLHTVGTGWTLATIYRASSGPSLTVNTATDRQLSGENNERPNQILSNPLCADPRPSCWINPAAFSVPALGTLGDVGAANIPGPGFFQLDVALSRAFRLGEKMTLEVRGEAFNITNSFRAGSETNLVPNGLSGVTTTQSNTFGQILSALDPRILQFAMKLVF
jgi:hypothetical protein